MRIGLVDVDSHNFPNLALMKISAWHKSRGDSVEWADMFGHYDILYKSKVFTFTSDDTHIYNADRVIKGGTGYGLDTKLPKEIEHIYPDYSIYKITDTAYGYMTRGCPRDCPFCIVAKKEGKRSVKVADLSEFWSGQKNIVLLDPNLFACKDWRDILGQLQDSRAKIDYTQGIDIRLMNQERIDALNKTRFDGLHFAWDNPDDNIAERKLEEFKTAFRKSRNGCSVFVLTNFNSTHEQDLYRIYKLREWGYYPYVMIYNKEDAPQITRDLQRWTNNRKIWRLTPDFEDYKMTTMSKSLLDIGEYGG